MARILIVEDERVVALDLRRMLKDWGYYDLAVSARGQDAIDTAAKFRPDLVLMDIVLEGKMDGVETAARIQQDNPVPVIFVTAHGDDMTSYRALEKSQSGVVRFVTKPVEEGTLRAAIQVALGE